MPGWCRFAAALAALATLGAAAQAPALKPGQYVTERGWGFLELKPARSGVQAFSLEAVGGNAHTCSLEGELRGGTAKLDGLDDKPCVVTITPEAKGLQVQTSTPDTCRYYCGMRAAFTGLYRLPPPACASGARDKARKDFRKLYDAKQYNDARSRLEPVLKDCAWVMDWLEEGRVRNDLAVTLHKLGELEGCRAVLKPLAEDAAKTDAQIDEDYPPTDAYNYRPIVRATRTNLRLCKG